MNAKHKLILPLLMALITVSYLSTGLYIPAIPKVEQFFQTSPDLSKLTQATYLLGLGVSQLIYGPLSDAYGRRNLILIGLSALFIGTSFCSAATDIHHLIIARFIQGLGAGGGISLTRAVIRDCFNGNELARVASYFTVNAFVFVSSAPLLGSYLVYYLGWRWVFVALMFISSVVLMTTALNLPETNRHRNMALLRPSLLRTNLKQIFSDRTFLIFTLIAFCAFSALMGWFTLSPMLLEKVYHFHTLHYGYFMFALGWINVIGGLINSHLTQKVALTTLIRGGLIFGMISAIILVLANLYTSSPLWLIIFAITVFTFGFTFIFANAFALAFSKFQHISGLASASFAFFQTLGGTIGSAMMSFSNDLSSLPFAILLLSAYSVSMIAISFVRKSEENLQ